MSIRKEVARALKRMHAWAALREIEVLDPEPRIQRMARAIEPRGADDRMADFLQHVPRSTVQPTETPLMVSDDLEISNRHSPKSRSVIRQILRHIRMLVRGATE